MKPGEELISQGLQDLSEQKETIPALLVSIGAPRLLRLGIPVPKNTFPLPELRLYKMLRDIYADAAHSKYNALIRRLVSFERSAKCVS